LGLAQEPAALFSLMKTFAASKVFEVGLCPLIDPPSGWISEKHSLPPMGASPDGLLMIPIDACAIPGTAESRLAEKLPRLNEWKQNGDTHICAVVEIKSVSPFRDARQRRGGRNDDSEDSEDRSNGKGKRYKLIDAGPREQVNFLHVPQLQMHMLCTGAPFALYLSFSVAKGMAIFIVKRDAYYQKQMLRFMQRFVNTFALKRTPPPPNFFFDNKSYQHFLGHTKKIARSAQLFETIPPTVMEKYKDSQPFL